MGTGRMVIGNPIKKHKQLMAGAVGSSYFVSFFAFNLSLVTGLPVPGENNHIAALKYFLVCLGLTLAMFSGYSWFALKNYS